MVLQGWMLPTLTHKDWLNSVEASLLSHGRAQRGWAPCAFGAHLAAVAGVQRIAVGPLIPSTLSVVANRWFCDVLRVGVTGRLGFYSAPLSFTSLSSVKRWFSWKSKGANQILTSCHTSHKSPHYVKVSVSMDDRRPELWKSRKVGHPSKIWNF